MDNSEQTVRDYLSSLDVDEILYEPDGNVPPDFVVGKRIAVEVRRLNENEEIDGCHRGLEETAKPLHAAVVECLKNSGPPVGSQSWFVHYTVRRPLPQRWEEVKRTLRQAVQQFKEHLIARQDVPLEIEIAPWMRWSFHPVSKAQSTLLLLGSTAYHDAGCLVVEELASNLQICIDEKSRKVASFRHRYSEWWLALEDRIAYGQLDADDVKQLCATLGPASDFDKVILVNPLNPSESIELYSEAESHPNTPIVKQSGP